MAAIYISPEMILSCTLGQLEKEAWAADSLYSSDIQVFNMLFERQAYKDIPLESLIWDFPSAKGFNPPGYWREYFKVFRDRIYLINDEEYPQNINNLVKFYLLAFKKELVTNGNLKPSRAMEIIFLTINEFVKYYRGKYGDMDLDYPGMRLKTKKPKR